ncbi:DNA repair protein [Verrucosispora sp. WMMD573]|uniref:DNA repair protein n=1 Tax=Verrucosispora sp. WMMD573 TaxID=3015149 RepID=UPI00248C04A6|nr:DNA repair protein [Verrucosispora sp. WMMD573]WBB56820.1 DNA repair protein [Verrucosispora sp. WMMD573]
MQKQPQDRDEQDPERAWRHHRLAGRFPAQAAYRGHRARSGTLSWRELDSLPAGPVRHHLNPH